LNACICRNARNARTVQIAGNSSTLATLLCPCEKKVNVFAGGVVSCLTKSPSLRERSGSYPVRVVGVSFRRATRVSSNAGKRQTRVARLVKTCERPRSFVSTIS
jgi:hypothetical protein